jgi:hypothetical protein
LREVQRGFYCALTGAAHPAYLVALSDLNLIHLLNFYLWVVFLLSTYRRFGQYRAALALVRAVPGRWPKLLELVRGHGAIFLTWATVLPGLLALLLISIQALASYYLWPEAGHPPNGLTVGRLASNWAALVVSGTLGAAMLAIDVYFLISAGEIDREQMQQYFDQAEYWLRSWTAPVLHVFTLGFVNPRRMVAKEVQSALVAASRLMNSTLWWVTAQAGARCAFGLSLWLAYAFGVGNA